MAALRESARLFARLRDSIATERQHHAAQLADLRNAVDVACETQNMIAVQLAQKDADLTAARAEIARLTENQAELISAAKEGTLIRCNVCTLHQGESRRAHDRAEAAEASLLALQQQMGDLVSMWRYNALKREESGPTAMRHCADELAAHLTGGHA